MAGFTGKKRSVFAFGLAMVVLLSLELLSAGAFRLLYGEGFSYQRIHEEQENRATSADPHLMGPDDVQQGLPRAQAAHPYMGFVLNNGRLPPSSETDAQMGNYGFATGRFYAAKPPDVAVVAIFGGSLAKRFSGPGGAALAAELENLGTFPGKKVTIVNAAIGSYKQPQQLIALSYLLTLGAKFDVIVNIDGFNELALTGAENLPQGVFPFFPRAWAFQTQFPDAQVQSTLGHAAYLRERRREWAAIMSGSPWRYSITAGLVWKRWDDRIAADSSRIELSLITSRRKELSFAAAGPSRAYADQGALLRDIAAVWARASSMMQDLCRARGICYVHVLQPNQYVPGSKEMGAAEQLVAITPNHPYRPWIERGYPELQREGARLSGDGVMFLDASMVFRGHPEPLYKDNCCHLNDDGYRVLAREIAKAVSKAVSMEPEP